MAVGQSDLEQAAHWIAAARRVVVLTGAPADLSGLAGRVREVWRDGALVARDGRALEREVLAGD